MVENDELEWTWQRRGYKTFYIIIVTANFMEAILLC
jgi:hypothetical protein